VRPEPARRPGRHGGGGRGTGHRPRRGAGRPGQRGPGRGLRLRSADRHRLVRQARLPALAGGFAGARRVRRRGEGAVAVGRAVAGPVILLPGMELSCRLDGCSLHMLAYVFDPDQPDLAAELTRIRDDRVLRARAMVDRLAGLGVDVSWEQVAAIAGQAVVGRPHIARAMADSGAIVTPREAFTG